MDDRDLYSALTAKKEVERNKQSIDLHVDSLSVGKEELKSIEIGRQLSERLIGQVEWKVMFF